MYEPADQVKSLLRPVTMCGNCFDFPRIFILTSTLVVDDGDESGSAGLSTLLFFLLSCWDQAEQFWPLPYNKTLPPAVLFYEGKKNIYWSSIRSCSFVLTEIINFSSMIEGGVPKMITTSSRVSGTKNKKEKKNTNL